MEIEKKAYLVGGPKNEKTREKIRLKMRMLLNNYKKCIVGTTSARKLDDVAFKLKKDGYKHFFCLYKSGSLENVAYFEEFFADMYCNEVDPLGEANGNIVSNPYFMFVACKKSKRAF